MMVLDRKKTRKIAFGILTGLVLFFVLIVYLRCLDLKRSFIAKASDKVTSAIGQTFRVEDLSISPFGGIEFFGISVENPEGFAPGQLLRIKRLRLEMRLRLLLEGKISFKNITIDSPELSLMRDGKGEWNISDRLFRFFSETSTRTYQVDELKIDSGLFDLNKDERYRGEEIHLRLENLSSDPGTRTKFRGAVLYGGNRIGMEGEVYLNDTPKKGSVTLSSKDLTLSAFSKFLKGYRINTGETRVNIRLHGEGDAEKGFHIRSNIEFKRPGFLLLKKVSDICLGTDITLRLRDHSLVIHAASLYADGVSVASLKGSIRDLKRNPSYHLQIRMDGLDLSRFNFMKDLEVRGVLTSDNLRLSGTFERRVPEVSGILRLREGGIDSNQVIIKKIESDLILSSDKEMSVKGEVSARVEKAGTHLLSHPVDARLSGTLRWVPDRMAIIASLSLSPLEMRVKGQEALSLGNSHFRIDGMMKGNAFSFKNFFEIKGMRYGSHTIRELRSNSYVDYRQDGIALKDLTMETEEVKVTAAQLKIAVLGNENGYKVDIGEMNGSYHDGEAAFRRCSLSLGLHSDKRSISGDIRFSAGDMIFQGMTFNNLSGDGKFDEKNFSFNIPQAEIAGGKVRILAQGRMAEGPFPVKTAIEAEGISLAILSKSLPKSFKLPYRVGGDLKRITFEGTIDSKESFHGQASLEGRELSVLNPEAGRNILKETSLRANVELMGKDLTFKVSGDIGTVSAQLTGIVRNFVEKDRRIQAKGILPEVKFVEIRNSFWDIFPDSLLYTGLDGSISSELFIDYRPDHFDVKGSLWMKDLTVKGENGEYSIGPIHGTLPIAYSKEGEEPPLRIPLFEKSQFDNLTEYYEEEVPEEGYHRITIGSLTYGFPLLEDIRLLVRGKGNLLDAERMSANIFGGKLRGSAVIDLSGLHYRAGFLVKGASLMTLCDRIESIKGFISGKVDGLASLKGSGAAVTQVIGKADFWTYRTKDEKTMISKKFLERVGGPSLKAYLGDRPFDKGITSLYLKDGYLIFEKLEISNRNLLGLTDLSIKVAPFNNRIGLDHLLWTITEAAERPKSKK